MRTSIFGKRTLKEQSTSTKIENSWQVSLFSRIIRLLSTPPILVLLLFAFHLSSDAILSNRAKVFIFDARQYFWQKMTLTE